ncbi:MAG: hypothetical protein KA419_03100 [Acidobacteria bacterium]|nr:hypothetical protein [Acidobacteriota bacterium]
MRKDWLLVLILILGFVSSGVVHPAPPASPAADLAARLAALQKTQSLKAVEPVQLYGRDNLADYVDGAVDTYLQFGYRRAATGEFAFADLPGKSFTVDLFGMDTAQGAAGIFTKEAGAPTAGLKIGVKAKRTSNSVSFHRGTVYAKITAFSSDKALIDRLQGLAAKLDALLQAAR